MLASGCFLETWEPTPALQLPLSMDSINHPSIIPFPRAAGKLKHHEKKKNRSYIIIALQHSLLAAKLLKLKYSLVDTLETAFQLLRGWGFILGRCLLLPLLICSVHLCLVREAQVSDFLRLLIGRKG